MRSVVKGGIKNDYKVQFVLDEAASLSRLDILDDAIDKYRAYGVRLLLIYQSLGQLKDCWPNGREQTLLANTSQVFFGVNDVETAELVSRRLGEETIVVESGGVSGGGSRQVNEPNCQTSHSSSWNNNSNWQLHARKLLKPEEVMALNERIAITFTPGVRPIATWLTRYYEKSSVSKWKGLRTKAEVWCVTILMALAAIWALAELNSRL
jgi:type IV secretion system protein VirD4